MKRMGNIIQKEKRGPKRDRSGARKKTHLDSRGKGRNISSFHFAVQEREVLLRSKPRRRGLFNDQQSQNEGGKFHNRMRRIDSRHGLRRGR